MENKDVRLGDGVLEEAKSVVNARLTDLVGELLNVAFDKLKEKATELPSSIEKALSNPKTKQEIVAQYSERLAKEGLIPSGYVGLPDDLLIHNFHQEGYIDGLFVGYKLALKAMVDGNVPEEMVLTVRDSLRPFLVGQLYEDRKKLLDMCRDEQYSRVEKG